MKRMKTIPIVVALYLFGAVLVGLPVIPLQELSLIDTATAAPPGAHRSAHRSVRPARGHTSVDVDVRGRGRVRDVDVDVSRHGRHRSVDIDVRRRPPVGAVAAAVVIGTRVAVLPAGCTTVITRGITYHHCGGYYYRPYYEGTTVVYVVVEKP